MAADGKYKASSNVFFSVREGAIVAWNFREQTQHEIDPECLKAIVDLPTCRDTAILKELVEARIIEQSQTSQKTTWGWDLASEIFHFWTRLKRQAQRGTPENESREYIEFCTNIIEDMPVDAFLTNRGSGDIALDFQSEDLPNNLSEILRRRTTNRTFDKEAIPYFKISQILDETFRYRPHNQKAHDRKGLFTPTFRRSSPSGGSLQSCEAYLISKCVTNLSPGIYHYRSHLRNLGSIGPLEHEFNFSHLFGGQSFADDLSAAIVISCRFVKMMWKYRSSRCYRVALLDAGHLSQTVQLIATALDIRTWPTAAFYDDNVMNTLGMSVADHEYPLMVIGLGGGEFNPIDRDLGDGYL